MIRKALLYSFASKYFTVAIQIASTLILARILTPEHIGLFTIASALTGIAQMFRDFGISEYIIKEKSLSRETLSAAFTASIIIAWPIAILFILLTPLVSLFYEHEDAGYLIAILSINMFLSPFGSIPMAVMRKNMNFKAISIANVSNTIVNALASLGFAFLSFGAYSLAFASVLGTLTTVIVITLFKDDSTSFGIQFSGIKKVLSFGKNVGGSNIIAYIAQNALDLFIAKNNDLSTLGLYSKTKSVITLFESAIIDGIRPLISPYFASANNTSEQIDGYVLCTKLIVYLSIPFCFVVAFHSEMILFLLFGEQWIKGAVYLKYIACGFFIYTLSIFYEQVLTTLDKSKIYLKFQSIIGFLKIVIACSSFFTTLENVIICLISISIIRLIWVIISLKKIFGLTMTSYFTHLLLPFTAGSVFITLSIISSYLINIQSIIYFILGLLIPIIGWFGIIWYCDRKLIRRLLRV